MTFFSGTDQSELNDSVGAYLPGYYLSLIVNHTDDWKAKVVYLLKEEVSDTVTGKIQNSYETGETVDITITAPRTPREYMIEIDMDVVVPRASAKPVLPLINATVGEGIMYNGQLLKISSNSDGILTLMKEEVDSVDDAALFGRIEYLDEIRKKRVPAYKPYQSTASHWKQNQYHHERDGEGSRFPSQTDRFQRNDQAGKEETSSSGIPLGLLTDAKCQLIVAKCLSLDMTFSQDLSLALLGFIKEHENIVNPHTSFVQKYVDMSNRDIRDVWDTIEQMIPIVLIEEFGLDLIKNHTQRSIIINRIKSAMTSYKNRNAHAHAWCAVLTEFCSNDHLSSFNEWGNIKDFVEAYENKSLNVNVSQQEIDYGMMSFRELNDAW